MVESGRQRAGCLSWKTFFEPRNASGAGYGFRIYFQDTGFANKAFMKSKRKIVHRVIGLCLGLAGVAAVCAGPTFAQVGTEGLTSPKGELQGAGGQDVRGQEAQAAQARFARRVDEVLGSETVRRGEWGVEVMDAATGDVLYERDADKYFVPASNMKLLTTALALDKLGVEYRFRTTVETNGKLGTDGVLAGDLILVGRGDPNLSNRKFPFETKEEFDGLPDRVISELADAVVARGVKEISGDIVGDDSYFPRERYPDGWEIGDMVWEYGAAISAIVVNDNTVTLTLTPGERAGEPVTDSVEPATAEFTVKNLVVTSKTGEKADLRLTREPGSESVVVTGTMPARATPRKLLLAIQEPAQHAASMLAKLLAERGVKFHGKIRAMHEPDGPGVVRTVLAEHMSLRLEDTVKLVNKISQNLHTEVLLRTAARQQGVWATPEDLTKFPEEFYVRAGIPLGDVVQVDGSGLSRQDMVTPRAFVALLQFAQRQAWFPAYYASLPVAGADGTLNERMKAGVLTGRIHAKTGSVTHVRALSGYAETPGGRRLIFSFLANNQSGNNHEAHDALDGLCLAMVQEFDVVPSVTGAAGGKVQ
jgi:D-alanyl-D-alanine carboxypeptidase/D-alanyl-D-alanine-endopeptidase (penicillin-binding protein 4)